jgi:hypothetical protein
MKPHKTHLLKYKTKLVQINDVFSLQIKYNAIGYFSALTQKGNYLAGVSRGQHAP